MDKIFIHNDVENLRFFSNKHGISASSDRITHYAMQGSDIIRVFYNQKDAIDYYNKNRYTEKLPVIYFFDQEKETQIDSLSKLTYNVSRLGEVAEHKTSLELQMFKLR